MKNFEEQSSVKVEDARATTDEYQETLIDF